MRSALVILLVAACGGSSQRSEVAKSPPVPPPAPVAGPPAPATSSAAAKTTSAPKAPPPPKVVLQLGDSFVGGWNGLAKALAPRFEALGSKFVRDWQDSVSIATYDREHRLDDLLAKNNPDLVLITLGANDVSVPFPSALAKHVASIARKVSAGGRACYWLSPPLWKKDTGIVDVIKQNAAPCKVFDGSHIKLARGGDGIHPNDSGGRTWAEAFFAFYNQENETIAVTASGTQTSNVAGAAAGGTAQTNNVAGAAAGGTAQTNNVAAR